MLTFAMASKNFLFLGVPGKNIAPFENSFSFGIFNNILRLQLYDILGISEANLYLEKTIQLKLVRCLHLIKINAWNSENVLQKLIIQDCESLELLPPLKNISSDNRLPSCCNFLVGKQKKLSYRGKTLSFQTLQSMCTETFFHSSLEELELKWFSLPIGFRDFCWCLNISDLELSYSNLNMTAAISFPPVFYGKQLNLSGFNLFDWHVQQQYPNLRKCGLYGCDGLVALPEMPMLTDLTVTYTSDLSVVQSIPTLISLRLRYNKTLSTILSSQNVIQAEISRCYSVTDTSGLIGVEKLELLSCCGLIAIPSFPNVKKLEISNCTNLSDLLQLTQDWKVDFNQKKRVVLYYLPALLNFSFCQNIIL
jgi:hypothetical protein